MDPSGVLVSSEPDVLDDSLSLLGFGGVGGANERISDNWGQNRSLLQRHVSLRISVGETDDVRPRLHNIGQITYWRAILDALPCCSGLTLSNIHCLEPSPLRRPA